MIKNINKTNIDNYMNYCEKIKKLSAHTIRAYKIDLKQFYDFLHPDSSLRNEIMNFIVFLNKQYKSKTVKRKIASIKAFVRYLYNEDIIQINPMDKIHIKFERQIILPKIIPEHIIEKIIKALYRKISIAHTEFQKYNSIRNAAIIELLYATGARISEICSLKVEDVDIYSRQIKILGKGNKERIVEVENNDVINILHKYIKINKNNLSKNNYFFLNNRQQRISEQSVRLVLHDIEKEIKSEIVLTPHMLRHSVATMLLEENVDIRYIQKILGHSSITTTQIYTHVTSQKQREILKLKHPRNKITI